MPTFQKKVLRRSVGLNRLGTLTLGTTRLEAALNSSFRVMDPILANPDFTGQGLYERAWVRAGSADYRVGSWNVASGAAVGAQTVLLSAIPSGGDFEIWSRIDPAAVDRYIDETIGTLRFRREVTIPTVGGANFYTLDGCASPHMLKAVLNAYVFANPSGTLNRDRRDLTQEQVVFTGTGMELRLPGGLQGSQQLVLDAVLQASIGAGDAATIDVGPTYDDQVILWGAAARCYDLLIQQAPSQEVKDYEKRRRDAVAQYNRLIAKGMPQIDQKIGFDSAFEHRQPWNNNPLDYWYEW